MSNKTKKISILLFSCALILSGHAACYAEVEPLVLLDDGPLDSLENQKIMNDAFQRSGGRADSYTWDASGLNDYGYDPYYEISNLPDYQIDDYYDDYDYSDDGEWGDLAEQGLIDDFSLPYANDYIDEYEYDYLALEISDPGYMADHSPDHTEDNSINRLDNPFTSNPNIATDVPGAFVDNFGILRPATTLEAFELGGEGQENALVDITRPRADKKAIAGLSRGLDDVENRVDYIKTHAPEYRDAGAITVNSRSSKGEIIVSPDAINKKFPDKAEYYQGNIIAEAQKPTYVGGEDDILMTLALDQRNATNIAVKDVVQSFLVIKDGTVGQGTASRIAKAGEHELYLTAGHCVNSLVQNNKQTEGDILFADLPPTSYGIRQDAREQFISDIQKLKKQKPLTPEFVKTNLSSDIGIFSIDRSTGQAVVGDSIDIIAINENDPVKGEKLPFYRRPIWFSTKDGAVKTKPRIIETIVTDTVYTGTDKIEGNVIDKDTLYTTDLFAVPGLSGSPAFQINKGGNANIGGIASAISSSGETYFVKPEIIRRSIIDFRNPAEE